MHTCPWEAMWPHALDNYLYKQKLVYQDECIFTPASILPDVPFKMSITSLKKKLLLNFEMNWQVLAVAWLEFYLIKNGCARDFKCIKVIVYEFQFCIQTPQAFLSAGGHQEKLLGTGILLPQEFCGKTMQAIMGQPINKI